ncbi:hypothetical protein GF386_04050 [Candidatus Pacearchaeota archaeon]|nr:hypothetical protein [Candidatus Pacearchaeota archaeon]
MKLTPISKKGAISLNDAPQVVMIVGFVFLIMATIAYISAEYRDSFSTTTVTVNNETLTTVTEAGEYVATNGACNFQDFSVTIMTNATGGETINSANYTETAASGLVQAAAGSEYNNSDWNVSYTYGYSGAACNVTESLESELDDNTSIAGIVLTISLVGIILSILMGIFIASRRRGM